MVLSYFKNNRIGHNFPMKNDTGKMCSSVVALHCRREQNGPKPRQKDSTPITKVFIQ